MPKEYKYPDIVTYIQDDVCWYSRSYYKGTNKSLKDQAPECKDCPPEKACFAEKYRRYIENELKT